MRCPGFWPQFAIFSFLEFGRVPRVLGWILEPWICKFPLHLSLLLSALLIRLCRFWWTPPGQVRQEKGRLDQAGDPSWVRSSDQNADARRCAVASLVASNRIEPQTTLLGSKNQVEGLIPLMRGGPILFVNLNFPVWALHFICFSPCSLFLFVSFSVCSLYVLFSFE